ncbi:MAG: DUF5519 family protein [Acidobacteria bacterium]|nr:DUF5519 family protein [Acidobacteriota bacterium]
MDYLALLEDEISRWPHISVYPHRFGGREFLFGKAEVGHTHFGGVVDIPFTRTIRDALLSEQLAEKHRFVPHSGWITFRMRSERDWNHALWLMRLSYLRYLVKSEPHPHKLFEEESERLNLSSRFKSLLEPFVPRPTGQARGAPS